MKYLVLSRDEDEVHIDWLEANVLEKRLNADKEYDGYKFINPPKDLEYFPAKSVCIIKGDVVIPAPLTVVTKFGF